MKTDHWNTFLSLCLTAKTTQELSKLLGFFLTIDEKENVIDRFLITKALLLGNQSQRDMSDHLNVSIAKITRGSNALKTIDPELKAFLLKQFRQDEQQE